MFKFSTFKNSIKSVDNFNKENVVLSPNSLRQLSENCQIKNIDFCYIIPKNKKLEEYAKIRTYFLENKLAIYSIGGIANKNGPCKMYMVTKKPTLTSEQFKSILNTLIEKYDVEVIYKNSTEFKHIKDYQLIEVKETNVLKYVQNVCKFNIIGIEVPLNENTKNDFYSNGLMIYPISPDNLRQEKNWNFYFGI